MTSATMVVCSILSHFPLWRLDPRITSAAAYLGLGGVGHGEVRTSKLPPALGREHQQDDPSQTPVAPLTG